MVPNHAHYQTVPHPEGKNIEFFNSGQNCGQTPFLRGTGRTKARFFSVFLAFSRFFEGERTERPLAPETGALPPALHLDEGHRF